MVLQHVPGSFNDLSLKYNNYSVSQELHYFKVMVFNTRSADVGDANSDSVVSIMLPALSKWVDVKIESESESVGSSVSISSDSPSQAELRFKLLKKNESIVLEGLVESASFFPISEEKSLVFSHRIPNVDRFLYIPNVSDSELKRSKNLIRWLVFVVLCALSTLIFRMALPQNSRVYYRDSVDNKVYSIAVNKDEMIVVDDPDAISFVPKTIIPFSEFTKRFSPVSQYRKVAGRNVGPIVLLIMSMIMIVFSFEEFGNLRRYKQFKRIQSLLANKSEK